MFTARESSFRGISTSSAVSMKGPSSKIRALLLLIAAGCTEAFCSLPLNAETLRDRWDQRDQRRCRSLAESRVIRMAAGDISEQAAAAMREAAAAQDRATQLKKDFEASKTRKQESAEATRFQPSVVKDEEELMDADDIAREMSEMLSGLQQRGTGSKKDPLAGVSSSAICHPFSIR